VGLSSGTDALLVLLMALGIGPGDEVITSPFTFVATASVISRLGARPVFADVLPRTYELRPGAVKACLTARTRAVLAVHLFGRAAELSELQRLCREANVPLLEDCAQACGARRGKKSAGTFGLAGAFSFFPTKNLGALGDGGALITDDRHLAEKVRSLRDQGKGPEGKYDFLGGNFRLDSLQAAALNVKLTHLESSLDERRQAAANYRRMFAQTGLCPAEEQTVQPGHRILLPPQDDDPLSHTYNLFVIEAERRDELERHLLEHNIGCRVYYRRPLHLEPCFSGLGYRPGDFPVAEAACERVLALPFFPGITPAQQQAVVDAIRGFYD